MEECAVRRVQVTTDVFVLLVLMALTAVQTSTSVHLAPVIMVVHVLKGLEQKRAVFVLKDLVAQDVILIFHSVRLTHAITVAHAMKDLEP